MTELPKPAVPVGPVSSAGRAGGGFVPSLLAIRNVAFGVSWVELSIEPAIGAEELTPSR